MTKSDFIDWKQHPVTKEVFRTLQARIQEQYEILGQTAGQDATADSKRVGAIYAYNELLGIDFEEETE